MADSKVGVGVVHNNVPGISCESKKVLKLWWEHVEANLEEFSMVKTDTFTIKTNNDINKLQ